MPGLRACHLIIDKQYRNNSDLKTKISAVLNHHYHCPELHLTPEGYKYLQLVPNKSFESKLHFKRDAVYLIAGGLGGIGRKLTQYLTQEFAAKVIVLGRSALDEEKTHFLTRCKLAYYYQVDIGDQSNLEACYQRIKSDFSQIEGVFNLVALSKDDYFLQTDLQSFEATCATKIKSTLNLDSLLASEPLDFFVLFSSIASVLSVIAVKLIMPLQMPGLIDLP